MGKANKLPPKHLFFAWAYNKLLKKATKFNVWLLILLFVCIQAGFKFFINYLEDGAILPHADFELMPLDLLMGYTPEEAYAQIEAYGAGGRLAYIITALSLDILYPVVYSLLLTMLLIILLQHGAPKLVGGLYKYTFVPFIVAVADLLENICISILLLAYPSKLSFLVYISSVFTFVKWTLILVIITALIVGFITYLAQRKQLMD
ncbi:MAG: hypothetical protein MK212_13730 [Saprospiraceae bacterium]|nr:hypothetical protein [Saprospiraceae bacterium]